MSTEPLRVALLGGMAAESADLLRSLVRHPLEVRVAHTFDGADTLEVVGDSEVVVTPRFPAALGPVAGGLRLVHSTGAGTELIDRAAVPAGVPICNCHGHARAMAEYALGAMLTLQRDLAAADRALRAGNWEYGASFGVPRGSDLTGARLVVLGGGESTRELARLGGAFGMSVTVVTRNPDRARDGWPAVRFAGLDALHAELPGADYVVASIPLTADTDGLLDAAALALLPPHAIVVNMARSRVVDEGALFDALSSGRLRAAAIDVWSRRPSSVDERLDPSEFPFAELDNVLITPHFAGWTHQTQQNRWVEIAANLDRLADGAPLHDIIDRGTR